MDAQMDPKMGPEINAKTDTQNGRQNGHPKRPLICMPLGACKPGQHGLGTESAISLRAERVVLMQPYFKFQKLAV